MNQKLWNEIMEKGKRMAPRGCANSLDVDDVETIVATMDFFNATTQFIRQTYYDLTRARFRVFDWLAMVVMSRNDDDRDQNEASSKVLVHAFRSAGYDERKFIENLREHDYQVEEEWESIRLD
ncbi:MAG: hypothetical protein WCQ53_03055 [bacterium]